MPKVKSNENYSIIIHPSSSSSILSVAFLGEDMEMMVGWARACRESSTSGRLIWPATATTAPSSSSSPSLSSSSSSSSSSPSSSSSSTSGRLICHCHYCTTNTTTTISILYCFCAPRVCVLHFSKVYFLTFTSYHWKSRGSSGAGLLVGGPSSLLTSSFTRHPPYWPFLVIYSEKPSPEVCAIMGWFYYIFGYDLAISYNL